MQNHRYRDAIPISLFLRTKSEKKDIISILFQMDLPDVDFPSILKFLKTEKSIANTSICQFCIRKLGSGSKFYNLYTSEKYISLPIYIAKLKESFRRLIQDPFRFLVYYNKEDYQFDTKSITSVDSLIPIESIKLSNIKIQQDPQMLNVWTKLLIENMLRNSLIVIFEKYEKKTIQRDLKDIKNKVDKYVQQKNGKLTIIKQEQLKRNVTEIEKILQRKFSYQLLMLIGINIKYCNPQDLLLQKIKINNYQPKHSFKQYEPRYHEQYRRSQNYQYDQRYQPKFSYNQYKKQRIIDQIQEKGLSDKKSQTELYNKYKNYSLLKTSSQLSSKKKKTENNPSSQNLSIQKRPRSMILSSQNSSSQIQQVKSMIQQGQNSSSQSQKSKIVIKNVNDIEMTKSCQGVQRNNQFKQQDQKIIQNSPIVSKNINEIEMTKSFQVQRTKQSKQQDQKVNIYTGKFNKNNKFYVGTATDKINIQILPSKKREQEKSIKTIDNQQSKKQITIYNNSVVQIKGKNDQYFESNQERKIDTTTSLQDMRQLNKKGGSSNYKKIIIHGSTKRQNKNDDFRK